MKIVDLIAGSFLIVSALLTSCTKIDAPYYTTKQVNVKDTVIDWDTVARVRKVLLEDYTGHFCTNCPDAAIIAKTLDASNHGKVIVMSVHAGFYARKGTGDYILDLQSAEGTSWNNDFAITSNPNGMVNRKVFNSNRIVSPDKWSESVSSQVTLAPDALIKILPTIDTTSLIIQPVIFSHFLNKLDGSFKITVCVLEDGILGSQKNNNSAIGPTPDWPNYVFDGVMRGTLNGANGELLTSAVDTTLTYKAQFSYTLNSGWNFHNCYLMAYIYNTETLEVVQTEKVKILK